MQVPPQRILVVDDDPEVAETHANLLRGLGYPPLTQSRPEQVEAQLTREPGIHLVLLDLRMPGLDGYELLQRIKVRRPDVGVIMATVLNDVEQAVRAIKAGAYNYLLKPLQKEQIGRVLESYFTNRPPPIGEDPRFRPFLTGCETFKEIFRKVKAYAEADVPVLLLGETGTGKEVIAQLLHAISARNAKRFLPLNIAALAPGLFESELFGHVRGAFTGATQDRAGCFEEAGDGTLFLDEIGELLPEQQTRLLRVLQTNDYARVGETALRRSNARLVLATHQDLAEEVRRGRFREDLYYRVANYSITIPPLRERGNDLELLADYFIRKYASQFGRAVEGLTPEALDRLRRHPFPGNVRELEGLISAAVLIEPTNRIRLSSLPESMSAEDGPLLERARCRTILQAMAECRGNQTRAAEKLGIARQTLNYLLKEYREKGWTT